MPGMNGVLQYLSTHPPPQWRLRAVKPTAAGRGSSTGGVDRVPPDNAAAAVSPPLVFPSAPLYLVPPCGCPREVRITSMTDYRRARTKQTASKGGCTHRR